MQHNNFTLNSKKSKGWTMQRADLIIGLISLAWGSSYLLMKIGLDGISPFQLIFMRFGIAFIFTALLFQRRLKNITKQTLKLSAILGLFLFGLFAFLLYGLKTTSASTAGFLTSTTVVFVPILQICITKKMPKRRILFSTFLTIIGISLLSVEGTMTMSPGAIICLAGAFVYACHILLTDNFTHKADSLLLGILQLGFAALYGLIFCILFEEPTLPSHAAQWGAILGLAFICSAFGFVMQPIAQKYTTPEHTCLLFSLEPVFSAILAFFFLHENLSVKGWIGAILILCSVLLSAGKRKPAMTISQVKQPKHSLLS